MFYRHILADFKQWSESKHRKPLILRGARQVGKTTAVRMFGKSFDTFIELNLEDQADRDLFVSGTDVQAVFNLILVAKKKKLTGKRTLLFIDEIQNSSEAMLSLRYFFEKMPEIFVIAAGSLLDIYIRRNRLEISVGRIEYLWMYPCTFDEFLMATGQDNLLSLMKNIPYPDNAYSILKKNFSDFALIGGMPEVIQRWSESNNLAEVRKVQSDILLSFSEDAVKYAATADQANVLKHILRVVYSEVCGQVTFEGFGKSDFKSQQIKNSIALLEQASLLHLLYPYTSADLPTIPKRSRRPKLLFLDTGFINLQANIQADYFTATNLNSIYKGIAMEHLFGQQLISMQKQHDFELGFWVREKRGSSAEIDFVIIKNNEMIPVEVKSGKTGSLKSLLLFMDEAPHKTAVRIYDGKTGWEKHKTPNGKEFNLLNLNLGLAQEIFRYLSQS